MPSSTLRCSCARAFMGYFRYMWLRRSFCAFFHLIAAAAVNLRLPLRVQLQAVLQLQASLSPHPPPQPRRYYRQMQFTELRKSQNLGDTIAEANNETIRPRSTSPGAKSHPHVHSSNKNRQVSTQHAPTASHEVDVSWR